MEIVLLALFRTGLKIKCVNNLSPSLDGFVGLFLSPGFCPATGASMDVNPIKLENNQFGGIVVGVIMFIADPFPVEVEVNLSAP